MTTAAVAESPKLLTNARRAAAWSNSTKRKLSSVAVAADSVTPTAGTSDVSTSAQSGSTRTRPISVHSAISAGSRRRPEGVCTDARRQPANRGLIYQQAAARHLFADSRRNFTSR